MREPLVILLSVVAGCTALNPAYGDPRQESGSGTGSGTGTGSVTTTGEPPVATTSSTSTSTSTSETGTVTTEGTETSHGSSETSSGMVCSVSNEDVMSDVFLVDCLGGCADANYGATEISFVGEGESTAYLLLRISNTPRNASTIEVTVTVRAQPDVLSGDYSLFATAISAPCDWAPGVQDGVAARTDSGATWNACSPTAESIPWGEPELSSPLAGWSVASTVLDEGSVVVGVPTPVTLTLTRDEPGLAPESIVVSSDVPDGLGFAAFASESASGPHVAVTHDCR